MSLALPFCPTVFAGRPGAGARPLPTLAQGTALLAAAAVVAGALSALPARNFAVATAPSAPYAAATLVADRGASAEALLGAAEDVRARLLSVSGVGAVALRGMQVAGLEIDYAPARLARFGLRPADLQAAVPALVRAFVPGRIAIRQDAAQAGPQPIADLSIRVGEQFLRLGDVATVARTALASPVSTLQQDGQAEVQIVVTPARGADTSLGRRVAAKLAGAALPGDVHLR